MTLPVTISGHVNLAAQGWGTGPWQIHAGGDVLHEVCGYFSDAEQWISDHGLTYDPTLVNP
jgi:hypothetical protein